MAPPAAAMAAEMLALDEAAALDLACGYRAVVRAALDLLARVTRERDAARARVIALLEERAHLEEELRRLRAQLVRGDEEAA